MSAIRPVAGKTRSCPHCKATILESASVCPGCHHHLRFDAEAARRQLAATAALKVEGTLSPPPGAEAQEYCVVISIRNERGEEVTRQVVGVGALQAREKRTFSFTVELLPPLEGKPPPAPRPAALTRTAPGIKPFGRI
jgi:hypothetical protein